MRSRYLRKQAELASSNFVVFAGAVSSELIYVAQGLRMQGLNVEAIESI
ncbi:MAG: hypothetical protein ACOX7R_03730 [Acetivibrionales bacterium]